MKLIKNDILLLMDNDCENTFYKGNKNLLVKITSIGKISCRVVCLNSNIYYNKGNFLSLTIELLINNSIKIHGKLAKLLFL